MPSERRYVLDTNVVVSALLLPNSVPRRAFDEACRRGRLVISQPLINELDDVLRRPHLDAYIAESERIEFLLTLIRDAETVQPDVMITDCGDPDDNMVLEAAVSGRVGCIVTGDNGLLAMHPYRGIALLTPRAFLDSSL